MIRKLWKRFRVSRHRDGMWYLGFSFPWSNNNKKKEVNIKTEPSSKEVKPSLEPSSQFRMWLHAKNVRFQDQIPLAINKIEAGKHRYQEVENATGVPWYIIGVIHYLEGNCNFNTHLHNGDPLRYATQRYPAGRPRGWNQLTESEKTWEASAIDSIIYDRLHKVKKWDISTILDTLERYNGLGYRKYHPDVPTPYLWSGTQYYVSGKYVERKVNGKWKSFFDKNLVSKQIGAVPLLKKLINK